MDQQQFPWTIQSTRQLYKLDFFECVVKPLHNAEE